MNAKPELIVKLFAGDTLIDESADAALWQRVLSEIRGLPAPNSSRLDAKHAEVDQDRSDPAVKEFAKNVGVTPEEIVGSLDPSLDAPYLHLDSHDWEALKKNTPVKGPGAISSAVLAATALVLWQKHANIGDIALQTVRAVLGTIDLEDQNAARSIGNCEWIQTKANRLALNPSRSSAATRLLRAYCRREPLAEAG